MLTCKLAMILLRGTAANDYRIEKKAHNPTNNVSFLEKSKKSEAQCTASDENLLSANNAAAHSKPKFFFGEKSVFQPELFASWFYVAKFNGFLISDFLFFTNPFSHFHY